MVTPRTKLKPPTAAEIKRQQQRQRDAALNDMGKSDDIDPDAVKSYNKEPVDDDQIDQSKPEGSRNRDYWDESKYRRRQSKGRESGGRFS
jgi:hypothetical protein